jgi:HK97 family phage major capsid protein
MPTILEKKQRRTAIHEELKALAKSAELTGGAFDDKQRAKVKELTAESEQLKAEISVAEADEDNRKYIDTLGKELNEGGRRKTEPDSLGTVRKDELGRTVSFMEATDEDVTLRFSDSPSALRRQTHALQRRADWDRLRSAGYKPAGKGGEFLSFSDFVRAGMENPKGSKFQNRVEKHYLAVQGMSEGVGADGGYLVMPEFAAGIVDRVYANDLWSRTDNYTVTGNNMTFNVNAETSRANGSRHGGLRGYWLAEGAAATKSNPTLRQVSMKLVKLGVLVYLTDELLEDGGAVLQQYVARKAAEEFNFMIGDSLVNGTGAGQPLGILNAPSLVSVAKEAGQAAATVVPENVVKMQSRFYAPNDANSVWLHNQDIGPQLHLMTLGIGTSGTVVYMPPGGLSGAPYATLQGRPLLATEFNATLGTQGDLIKADLGQMLSISKGGIMSAASIHVEFLTDQLALRFIMRLNAQPWESAPITPYKGTSNTQSNFVALDTRS